jgi:nitrous oxidase accessory protein
VERTFRPTQSWQVQIILLGVLITLPLQSRAAELQVCPTCDYHSIQTAANNATEGDTVTVSAGVYREGTIVIKKPIKLMGRPGAIIDGNNQNQILVIFKANGVLIKGFTFKNTGVSFTSELAGIRVIESTDCRIEDNTFVNTNYGIYLEKSHLCRVTDNQFKGKAVDEASGGNGIHIWTGSDHHIEGNHIDGHRDGIYLEFVKNSLIKENHVQNNLRYGLHFMFSNNTKSQNNTYSFNGSGVAIMYSQNILIENNTFSRNKGTASYGLLLKDINASTIRSNQFMDNSVGIYMEGSNRSQFLQNQFQQNGYALRIMGNCENNEFINNNYIGNSFDVTTNSSMSWNNFRQNYWSRYRGYDLNHDTIGDVPFRPVSLSSVVVETFDSSFYLIGSFLFDLLDFVEHALPELTPETLKDDEPLINPWVRELIGGPNARNQ